MEHDKAMWLEDPFAKLVESRVVYPNPQAGFDSVVMAMPKKSTYRMIADYRAVNNLVTPAARCIPNLEEIRRRMAVASVFCTLDPLLLPKKTTYRMVADYRAVNNLTAPAAMPMPKLEEIGRRMAVASVFCTLHLLHGYWQMRLDPRAQGTFTMVATNGLFTPTPVLQGVLNATSKFEGTVSDVSDGMLGEICLLGESSKSGWTT